ncbi:uncharacterized protein C4orf45 homolog [Protopterus annectens]|uniref:uncharacterized protein C4orf45 homolog n=1 Tax=Protopterus annectens TaxID=7888 RepID=UPI001CFB7C17|nr:uncharacterized protein C4orf45 homolog [Protopterus annectens]
MAASELEKDRNYVFCFTGPDNIGDYRPRTADFTLYIGNSTASSENTGDLNYLFRAAAGTLAPLRKEDYVGCIGWGLINYSSLNERFLNKNQLKRKEFWQAYENRHTHRYQNPWQSPPNALNAQGQETRSTLPWMKDQYDNYYHRESKWYEQFYTEDIPLPLLASMRTDGSSSNRMLLPH